MLVSIDESDTHSDARTDIGSAVSERKAGGQLGNVNGATHGLRLTVGRLPKGCSWIKSLVSDLVRVVMRPQGLEVQSVIANPANLQSMATSVLEAFAERRIDAFQDPNLRRALDGTRVVSGPSGMKLKFARDKHGHGDSASALAMALHGLKDFSGVPFELREFLLPYPRMAR